MRRRDVAGAHRRHAPNRAAAGAAGHERHGNADEELNAVYQVAGGRSVTRWEIPQAGHTGGLAAALGQYERRVVRFFDAALLPR